jgi:site-specific DNA-methyltransferase (adenine-specific)
MERIILWRDSFQNWKNKDVPKAQLILTDLPYQLGDKAFASNPVWYNGGDNTNGESDKAHKSFFNTDDKAGFRIPEFFHFCANLLKKEPKKAKADGRYDAPCMILFCAFEQIPELVEYAQKAGFAHYINLVFYKNYSAQVLKANMRIVGNCEYGLLFYRDHLPKFRNNGRMIFNCMPWLEDRTTPKVHPTQKPVPLLEYLIRIFTDIDDVVIDCCAGSGTTLLAAKNTGRRGYGFELMKEYVDAFYAQILPCAKEDMFTTMQRKENAKQLEITKAFYAKGE